MCSVKKVLLENSQNSQENTCAKVSILIKLWPKAQVYSLEFCKHSKNASSYRTPSVAASAEACEINREIWNSWNIGHIALPHCAGSSIYFSLLPNSVCDCSEDCLNARSYCVNIKSEYLRRGTIFDFKQKVNVMFHKKQWNHLNKHCTLLN